MPFPALPLLLAVTVAGPGGPIVLGKYGCTQSIYRVIKGVTEYEMKGSVTLRPNGTYQYLDNGKPGRYRYDAKSGVVTWIDGPFKAMQASTTYEKYKGRNLLEMRFKDEKGREYKWICGNS